MNISRSIVKKVKIELDPPGRFLERDAHTELWHQVDDKRAVEKTAQALRDGAAPLRKKMAKEDNEEEVGTGGNLTTFLDSLIEECRRSNGDSPGKFSTLEVSVPISGEQDVECLQHHKRLFIPHPKR